MKRHRIEKRKGTINRVRSGESPSLDLPLRDNQRVISVEFREINWINSDRVTTDYIWTAYIETVLA